MAARRSTPTLIDRVQDRTAPPSTGTTRGRANACRQPFATPVRRRSCPTSARQVADPRTAYQIVPMLEGVVQRGTGTAVQAVGKPLAGKTGTTNDSLDDWFIGFSPDLVVGVFVGFDQPRTLGPKETGGATAAPIFRDFMKEALTDKPAIPFRIPPGSAPGARQSGDRACAPRRARRRSGRPSSPAPSPIEDAQQQVLTGIGETATIVPGAAAGGPSVPAGGGASGGTGGLYRGRGRLSLYH